MSDGKRFLTDSEVGIEYPMFSNRGYRWRLRKSGRLTYYRVNGKIIYERSAIESFLEACKRPAVSRGFSRKER